MKNLFTIIDVLILPTYIKLQSLNLRISQAFIFKIIYLCLLSYNLHILVSCVQKNALICIS